MKRAKKGDFRDGHPLSRQWMIGPSQSSLLKLQRIHAVILVPTAKQVQVVAAATTYYQLKSLSLINIPYGVLMFSERPLCQT